MAFLRTGWPNVSGMLAPEQNNFTALRLVAALCVVVSHSALLATGYEEAEPMAGFMAYTLGEHGLHAFFYISGLTIAASLARSRSIAAFATGRVLRIWPALLVVSCLLAVLFGPIASRFALADYFIDPSWRNYLAGSALLASAGRNPAGVFVDNPHPNIANGALWTLKYEVLCYIVLAGGMALSGWMRMRSALWAPLLTIAAGLWMMTLPVEGRESHFDHIARLWFAFGLGVVTWQVSNSLRPSVLVMAGLGLALWLSLGGPFERPLSVMFVGSLVLVFGALPAPGLRSLTNQVDLSYGLYIVAWPVTQILVAYGPSMPLPALMAAACVLSAMLAWMSWTFVERPVMSMRPTIVRVVDEAVAILRRLWGRLAARRNAHRPVNP